MHIYLLAVSCSFTKTGLPRFKNFHLNLLASIASQLPPAPSQDTSSLLGGGPISNLRRRILSVSLATEAVLGSRMPLSAMISHARHSGSQTASDNNFSIASSIEKPNRS